MTDSELRVALAEALGCKKTVCDAGIYWDNPNGKYMGGGTFNPLPDYPNDLNACHAAEATLTIEQQYQYGEMLVLEIQSSEMTLQKKHGLRRKNNDAIFMPNGFGWFAILHATARQRSLALVKVLSLRTLETKPTK